MGQGVTGQGCLEVILQPQQKSLFCLQCSNDDIGSSVLLGVSMQ